MRSKNRTGKSRPGAGAKKASDKAAKEAVALWKIVATEMKLKDLSLHLQGLYAELGKTVFEHQAEGRRSTEKRSRETEELLQRIAEMRKTMAWLGQDAGSVTRPKARRRSV